MATHFEMGFGFKTSELLKKYNNGELDNENYNAPFYADDIESKSVFIVNKNYFIKDKNVISAISLDPFYYKDCNGQQKLETFLGSF